jgi:hypothetical protein
MAKKYRDQRGGYRPTFQVSHYQKPWYTRLTPVAWVALGVFGFLIVLGIFLALGRINTVSNDEVAQEFGMAKVNVGEGTVIPTVAIEAGIANVGVSGTATPVPVRFTATPRPTSTPRPTTELKPTRSTDRSRNLDTGITWQNAMTETATGEWMAPLTTVERTQRDIEAYFKALQSHASPQDAYKDYVQDPEGFFQRYFEGEALRTVQTKLNPVTVDILRKGETQVKVVRYSRDGSLAIISIAKRNWVVESFDRATLLTSRLIDVPDEDLLWQARFSSVDGRWKIMNVSALPANGAVFSPEGQAAFDQFFKKTVKENPPQNTPTP